MNIVSFEFKSTENMVLFWAFWDYAIGVILVLFHMLYLCCTIQLYFSILQTLGNCFFSTSKYFFLLFLRQIRPGGLISPEVSNTLLLMSVTHIFKILKEKVAVCEFLWLYPVGNFVEWLLGSAYLTQLIRLIPLEKGRVTPWLWNCQWNRFNASFLWPIHLSCFKYAENVQAT